MRAERNGQAAEDCGNAAPSIEGMRAEAVDAMPRRRYAVGLWAAQSLCVRREMTGSRQ